MNTSDLASALAATLTVPSNVRAKSLEHAGRRIIKYMVAGSDRSRAIIYLFDDTIEMLQTPHDVWFEYDYNDPELLDKLQAGLDKVFAT